MCGINGFSWSNPDLIKKMNTVTKNRGPDDEGVFIDTNVSLGHSRLSIIDLSPKGHQPMCNEDETIWLTYNGEIYNFHEIREDLIKEGHIFTSHTDSEVIIHAYEQYGMDCLNRFNGMWAFCMYDKNRDRLILSRDQFGIKPLYYYIDDKKIIFSSMIAAILCHDVPVSPNECAIMEFLSYNLEGHDTYTFFTGIEKIPQDSFLMYDITTKKSTLHRWYYPACRKEADTKAIRNDFMESIRLRTIADVPIGSCLSGGVDSTAIVCILDTIVKDTFNTFSLIAPGFSLDESTYITEVGKHTHVHQYFTQISGTDFINEFHDIVRALEEPVTGLSAYAQYVVMKLAHEHKAKVLLDGQGGDEIFAGYDYYFAYYFYELFVRGKWITLVREMIQCRKNFKTYFPHQMFAFLMLPDSLKYHVWKSFGDSWINHDYLQEKCKGKMDPRWKRMTLQESLSLTLYSTAIPHLLRMEDKNSMRWSIESRPPFLDINLVGAAMSLPSDKKISDGRTKIIFREAMNDILPSLIRDRKDKIGFAAPADEFFRKEEIITFCRDIIYSENFKNRPYWNWTEVERHYRNHLEGKSNIGETIWKWINLEIWLREFFIESTTDMSSSRQGNVGAALRGRVPIV